MSRPRFNWNLDPSAGGNRWRCFLRPFELYVYEDGTWGVFDNERLHDWSGQPRARGQALSVAAGQQHAVAALKLVKKLRALES